MWSGNHLLDSFHIIRNLRKNLKNENLFLELRKAVLTENNY